MTATTEPAPSKFPLGDEAALSDSAKALRAKCQEKLGFVPNVLQALAFRPHQLDGFSAFHDALMLAESPLSKLEREMIAVVVSSANRCWYCLVAHGSMVRAMSGDAQLTARLLLDYREADLAPKLRAMLDFAWRLTKTPKVSDADRQALRAAGLSDTEMFDLAQVASFFNYTNRAAAATGMEPNPEYLAALMAPTDAAKPAAKKPAPKKPAKR